MTDKKQPEALRGAPPSAYSQEDHVFYTFWYGHMLNDLMQPPLAGVSHSTARYIWDAAIAHVAAQPAGAQQPDTAYAELPSYEHQRAIMEAERNASLDEYSRIVPLTSTESMIYERAFTNGWNRNASHGQAPAQPAPQQAELDAVAGQDVMAWMTQEGDRVVTARTMGAARRGGGAMLSSLRDYSVALVRANVDAAMAAQGGK